MLDIISAEWNRLVLSFMAFDFLRLFLVVFVSIVTSWVLRRIIDIIFNPQPIFQRFSASEDHKKRQRTIGKILKTFLDIIIWCYATVTILTLLGVDVPSLMTGAGLIGVVIGLGAQNTVRDIVAGIFIVAENQYRVGDSIETQVAGRLISGKVENISLRITQVRDTDGKLHTIRNGASESVTNMSFKYANVNLAFGVAYHTDINKLEKVINRVGEEMLTNPDLKKEIIEPIRFLRINKFLDSSMEVKCLGRVKAGRQWHVAGEFRRLLKNSFDKNDIELPYPQVVIHNSKEHLVPRKLVAKPTRKAQPKTPSAKKKIRKIQ